MIKIIIVILYSDAPCLIDILKRKDQNFWPQIQLINYLLWKIVVINLYHAESMTTRIKQFSVGLENL
jgi:hypothetical protein